MEHFTGGIVQPLNLGALRKEFKLPPYHSISALLAVNHKGRNCGAGNAFHCGPSSRRSAALDKRVPAVSAAHSSSMTLRDVNNH